MKTQETTPETLNGAAVETTSANRGKPEGAEPPASLHVEEGERRILAAAWLDVVTAQRAYSLAFGSIRQHHNLPENATVSTETGEITLPPQEPRE